VILKGLRRSPAYLVMRLIVNVKAQMQDLPILLHVDGTVVVIIVLGVVVRLVTSIVVRRRVRIRVDTTGGGLVP
jgi:hypothetical protein